MSVSASPSAPGLSSAEHALPIHADYYNIIDEEGWPVAALLVLIDRRRDPVRAELHLYEELADEVRHWAFRQGRALLEARYYSDEPVPLKIFQSYQGRETVQVRANSATRNAIATEPVVQRWQWAAAAGIALLLLALVWALATFLRGPAVERSVTGAPATQNELATEGQTEGGDVAPPTLAAANDLPPSQHADPNLAVGKRVRVRPELRLSLVAEPGPDKNVVGYMQDQQEAIIVDGPVMTQGTSDTIVWWRVRLDDGAEAWAPANTSAGAVLELVE